MDSSSVGKSEGGTGKSIWANMFEHLLPTYVIDAKSPRLTDDPHLYDGVDDRTDVVVFDDCRRNLNFEFFLSQITRGLTVNPKGEKKFTIDPPKFIFTTNHAIRGSGNSFHRRQYIISFSNYYNGLRSPKDDFGNIFFYEWEGEQWNLFYNLMAQCVQLYLKYGLAHTGNDDSIIARKLRQEMGESFLDFADTYFASGSEFLNVKISIIPCFEHFVKEYPQQRKFANKTNFKQKLQYYAKYSGMDFNPPPNKKRIRSNSKEYFVISDGNYNHALCSDSKYDHFPLTQDF